MKRLKLRNCFLATVAVAVISVATPVTVDAATKFTDVPESYGVYKEIHAMVEQGIINGYPDGTFKPNELISRKHAAALISRAFDSLPKENSKMASDVQAKNTYMADITKIVQAGIIELDENGNFRPNDLITRGEMAKALVKAYNFHLNEFTETGVKRFKDAAGMKYNHDAEVLRAAGITTGYEDNTFRENQGLSRAHYAAFMYRASTAEKKFERPKPRPEPAPLTPEEMVLDKKLEELSAKFKIAEPPNGKSREDATAENIQAGTEFHRSYPKPSHISEFGVHKDLLKQKIINLTNSGYTESEALDFLNKLLVGETVETLTPKGKHLKMYLLYKPTSTKIVTILEKTDFVSSK